jgi:hypothetical protein
MLSALLCLALSQAPAADAGARPPSPIEEALLEAVRKGDLAGVRSALDGGAAVDARFRYDRTPLSFAADRGEDAIVRLLLERGADPNARDTFYKMSALDLALHKGHVGVARALIEKGATGSEQALGAGVSQGNVELVKLALAQAKPTADELSAALAAAKRANAAELVRVLEAAGAVPPPPADFVVPPEVLARYAGAYRVAGGSFEARLEVQNGALVCTSCGAKPWVFGALDLVTFRPQEHEDTRLVFRVEAGRVTGLTLFEGREQTAFERVVPEEKK